MQILPNAGSPPVDPSGVREKVAFLRRPQAYARVESPPPAAVTAVETHMAWVFLTDRHAWKLKKPVRYDFLDFGTLEARRRDGLEEVALNARLSPGVYLGVVPLAADPAGGWVLGGAGEPVEWLVKMRRLPADDFLDARLRSGGVSDAELEALAERLAGFYASAPRIRLSGRAYRQRLLDKLEDDVRELERHDPDSDGARATGEALSQFVSTHVGRLEARASGLVEGHGDLRPEHVCLETPPVVIDCLEFNRDFRILDPLDELAFLAMECGFLGAERIGRTILLSTCERLGVTPSEGLVAFYGAARAILRAKLALSHVWDVDHRDHGRWRSKGRAYLALARRLAGRARAAVT